MTNFNQNQLDIADAIDELKAGEGIEFSNGVYVERESPERFTVNRELRRFCFIEACLIAVKGIE